MLASASNNADVAYASVFDGKREVLVERRFGTGLAKEVLPPLDTLQVPLAPGHFADRDVTIARQALHRTRRAGREAPYRGAATARRQRTGRRGARRLPAARHDAGRAAPRVPRAGRRRRRRGAGAAGLRHPRHAAAHPPPRGADAPADARRARGRRRPPRRVCAGELVGRAGPADPHVQSHDAKARASRSPKSPITSGRSRTRSRSGRRNSRSPRRTPTSWRSTTS